jgi:hypothetical protein
VSGPAGTLALVLSETAAGGAVLLFLSPLWGEVKRGFFLLTGFTLLALGLAAWGAVSAGREGSDAADWALRLALAFSVTTALWVLLLLLRARGPARAVGLASVPVSLAMLAALAATGEPSPTVAVLQLLAGAAFLGAVWDGLLLGHWYLVDRGLARRPIDRLAILLLVGVALETIAVVAGGFGATEGDEAFNRLLTAAGLAPWIAVGMVAATGLIAVMIRLTLKGRRSSAVQAATGLFYLAVITGFTAELAAKVRFLG